MSQKNYDLKPPTDEEFNKAAANRMFGKFGEKMLKYAPWSFLIIKNIWKKGEEPWRN